MVTAVLVIDMIQEFVTGKLGNPRAQKIVPNVAKLLEAAKRDGVLVVYLTDNHLPGIDPEFEIWGAHAEAGSEGTEIIPELQPGEGDHRIYKRHYSCFYATGLDALLRELGVTRVVMTGVLTNVCIQHTAADAYFRRYEIVVPSDCVNALTEDEHASGLAFMERMYGVELTTPDELIAGGLTGGSTR
jgi:nicotinamidase-related amidase